MTTDDASLFFLSTNLFGGERKNVFVLTEAFHHDSDLCETKFFFNFGVAYSLCLRLIALWIGCSMLFSVSKLKGLE